MPLERQSPVTTPARAVLPLVGFVILTAFTVLYAVNPRVYRSIIDLWSFIPFPHPFLDSRYLSAQIDCWQQGVNVYVTNPCDVLGRVQNLSPLWLRFSFWPVDARWVNLLGLSIDGAFLVSLVVVPWPRRSTDAVLLCSTLISPAVMYGLERANQDLFMFVLIAMAVVLLERSFVVRLLGYAMILLAALLKFYPAVVLCTVLREKVGAAAVIAMAASAVVMTFVLTLRGELAAALANIPMPSSFVPGFGAMRLPTGTLLLLHGGGIHGFGVWWRTAAYVGLLSTAVTLAFWLSTRPAIRQAVSRLLGRERLCLLAGASVICGCFFAGSSLYYRGVYALLVLPGLFAVARSCPSRSLGRVVRGAAGLLVVLLFSLPLTRLMHHHFGPIEARNAPGPTVFYWACRELAWWMVVIVLLAIGTAAIQQWSPIIRRISKRNESPVPA
jgi:hypothetical protein